MINSLNKNLLTTISTKSLKILKFYSFQLNSVTFQNSIEKSLKDKLLQLQYIRINKVQQDISNLNKEVHRLLNNTDSDINLIKVKN
jgi:hypothetical protein